MDRIKETRFSLLRGQSIERLAKGMGVLAEVLAEAQEQKATELAKLGRNFVREPSGQAWRSKRCRLSLWCPADIRADIAERASRMELTAGELVRGIVQTLLSGPDNPVFLLPHWRYHGEIAQRDRDKRNVVRVELSVGADVALRQRAQRFSVSTLSLVRGAVADYLEGRMRGAYFVETGEMWEDPSRYWTGELTRKGEYIGHAGIVEARVASKH